MENQAKKEKPKYFDKKNLVLLAILLVIGYLIFTTGEEKKDSVSAFVVTSDDLPANVEWPLTIPEITIDCSRHGVLLGRHNDVTYTMTGSAKSVNQRENRGWSDIYLVTKPEPGITASNGTVYISTLADLNSYAIDKCKALNFWLN